MSGPHFMNPNEYNAPNYAIWNFDPLGYEKWLDLEIPFNRRSRSKTAACLFPFKRCAIPIETV